jgi:hypothetical protein
MARNTACSGDSTAEELSIVDSNVVDTGNNVIGILGLDQQVQQMEVQINLLLDRRTQTIIQQATKQQATLDNALKQRIEEALEGGKNTAIASFELPASLGGYLDAQPIGVKAIVTKAISDLQQAAQPVPVTAAQSLAAANSALAAGQYKAAFFKYQIAYLALAK